MNGIMDRAPKETVHPRGATWSAVLSVALRSSLWMPVAGAQGDRLEDDWVPTDDGRSLDEIEEAARKREAAARAVVLEMIGDLPEADAKPPSDMLFVCKLNPVTTEEARTPVCITPRESWVVCRHVSALKTIHSLLEAHNSWLCDLQDRVQGRASRYEEGAGGVQPRVANNWLLGRPEALHCLGVRPHGCRCWACLIAAHSQVMLRSHSSTAAAHHVHLQPVCTLDLCYAQYCACTGRYLHLIVLHAVWHAAPWACNSNRAPRDVPHGIQHRGVPLSHAQHSIPAGAHHVVARRRRTWR